MATFGEIFIEICKTRFIRYLAIEKVSICRVSGHAVEVVKARKTPKTSKNIHTVEVESSRNCMTINENELFAYGVYVVELKSGPFESTLMEVVSSWPAT